MKTKDARHFWRAVISGAVRYSKARKYSEVEALVSAAIDCWQENEATVYGYSELWGWSTTKARSFLERVGLEIVYSNPSKKRGQIRWKEKKQLNFNYSNKLQTKKNNKNSRKIPEKQFNSNDSSGLDPPKKFEKNTTLTGTILPTVILEEKKAARPDASDEAAALSKEKIKERNQRLEEIIGKLPSSKRPAQRIIKEYKTEAKLWRVKR